MSRWQDEQIDAGQTRRQYEALGLKPIHIHTDTTAPLAADWPNAEPAPTVGAGAPESHRIDPCGDGDTLHSLDAAKPTIASEDFADIALLPSSALEPESDAGPTTVSQSAADFATSLTCFETAVHLYHMGLNVFPSAGRDEALRHAAALGHGAEATEEAWYLLSPLLTSRLHLCTRRCRRRRNSGQRCLRPHESFEALFDNANVAVMTGRTSGNLVAVECDAHETFVEVLKEFRARRLDCWSYTTHLGGVCLFRLSEAEAANGDATPYPGVRIWGREHPMLLPPSLHPEGTFFDWFECEPLTPHLPNQGPPELSAADVEWLGVSPVRDHQGWQEPDLHGLPASTAWLSRRNRLFLAGIEIDDKFGKRMAAAANDIAGNQLPRELALQLLLQAGSRCDPPYSEEEVAQVVDRAYSRERKPARSNQSGVLTAETVTAVEAYLRQFEWQGRTNGVDRKVAFAFCTLAKRGGGGIFRAAGRELAELSGTTQPTAAAAIKRLCGEVKKPKADILHLVERAGRDRKSGATLLRFRQEIVEKATSATEFDNLYHLTSEGLPDKIVYTDAIPLAPEEKDAEHGLGRLAWRIWNHLVANPEPSRAAVARALRVKRSNVYRPMKRLKRLELVYIDPADGCLHGAPRSLDELGDLTVKLGTWGWSVRQKAEHQRQREVHVNRQFAVARRKWNSVIRKHEFLRQRDQSQGVAD